MHHNIMCAMVKSRYIGDGHPTFNRSPYNGYINPYNWVDDHPLLYGNNGSLDPGTCVYTTVTPEIRKNLPSSRLALRSPFQHIDPSNCNCVLHTGHRYHDLNSMKQGWSSAPGRTQGVLILGYGYPYEMYRRGIHQVRVLIMAWTRRAQGLFANLTCLPFAVFPSGSYYSMQLFLLT